MKLLIGFVHGGRGDEVQKYTAATMLNCRRTVSRYMEFDHNTRAGTKYMGGTQGQQVYHYDKSVSASQSAGWETWPATIPSGSMDGNR